MRFFSKINEHLGHLRSRVVERRDTVEAIYEHSETAQINAVDILEILSWCPERDSLTLTFNLDDEVVYSITSKTVEKLSSALKTSESCLCEYNELKIQIDKTVLDNRFSVFDLNSFAKDIIEQPLIEIMRWFSAKLEEQDYLVFDVFDSDISFSTGTMAFISSANSSFTPDLSRKERLSLCQESSFFHNMCTYRLIPEDFLIRGIGQIDNPFKSLFERMSTMLAIIYTASSALLSDSLLTVQISGHRTTSRNFTFKDIVFNKSWIALYEWIYTDGNTTDKSIIAHNILSLHCKYADLLVIDETINESIKTSYRLYLRSNATQYLELKKSISEFIRDVVAKVGDSATMILSQFKANLLAIFVFLFTVILSNIGAKQNWGSFFSRDTIYIIELVLFGSIFYMVFCYFEAKYKLKKTINAYYDLKDNYKGLLSTLEINEAFGDDQVLSKTRESTQRGIWGWSSLWGMLLIIAIIIIEFLTINRGIVYWLIRKICP